MADVQFCKTTPLYIYQGEDMSMWTAALTGFLGGVVQGATAPTEPAPDSGQASTTAKTDAVYKET